MKQRPEDLCRYVQPCHDSERWWIDPWLHGRSEGFCLLFTLLLHSLQLLIWFGFFVKLTALIKRFSKLSFQYAVPLALSFVPYRVLAVCWVDMSQQIKHGISRKRGVLMICECNKLSCAARCFGFLCLFSSAPRLGSGGSRLSVTTISYSSSTCLLAMIKCSSCF